MKLIQEGERSGSGNAPYGKALLKTKLFSTAERIKNTKTKKRVFGEVRQFAKNAVYYVDRLGQRAHP